MTRCLISDLCSYYCVTHATHPGVAPAQAPQPPMGTGPGRVSASDRLPRPWLFPLLVFAATWVLIVASWTLGARLIVPGYHAQHWYSFLWYKDVSWYWGVALYWYAPQGSHGVPVNAAWFPLFPAWLRLCSYLAFGNKVVGALLAMIISGGASAILVWSLASRIRGHWVADRAVILYCAFPGAMMLAGAYSEALGIALVTASLLAAVNRRWLLAGLFGLLTTAEHPTLVVIVPALALTALHAIWTRRDWRSLLAPALAPLGIVGYFAWIGTRYHDYLFWFRLERKGWGQKIDFGKAMWQRLTLQVGLHHTPKHLPFVFLCDLMFAVLVAGVVLMLIARLPLPVTAYTVLLAISLSVSNGAGPRPRLVWAAIGIFIGGAALLPRWAYWPVVVASAALMAFLVTWWPAHPLVPPP